MKLLTAAVVILSALLFGGCASQNTGRVIQFPDAATGPLPPGVLKEGSLANPKLMADAATAATDRLKAKGYFIDPKGVPLNQYVVSMPTGTAGKRTWTEHWVFLVENKEMPFTLHFQEDGSRAAHFVIEDEKNQK